jgi:hypothetical protein
VNGEIDAGLLEFLLRSEFEKETSRRILSTASTTARVKR